MRSSTKPAPGARATRWQAGAYRPTRLHPGPICALDRRRPRSRPFPLKRYRAGMAPSRCPRGARGRLCARALGDDGQSILFLGGAHPDRPRSARDHCRALCLHSASGLSRLLRNRVGKRRCTRLVARDPRTGRAGLARSDGPRCHGRPHAAGRTAGLPRLCYAGALARPARGLVKP